MKKKYSIEHTPTYASIDVIIDHSHPSLDEAIKVMVDFWTGSEKRLDYNDGDYLATFLKQLCAKVIGILAENNYNASGVIDHMQGEEGWCLLDGSFGIELTYADGICFDNQDDFEIQTLELK